MVAVTAAAGMPHNQFSAVILGGSWPGTDPSDVESAAEAARTKAASLLDNADSTRREADSTASEMSGDAVEGFYNTCYRPGGRV